MTDFVLPSENDPFGRALAEQLESGRLAQLGEGDTDLSAMPEMEELARQVPDIPPEPEPQPIDEADPDRDPSLPEIPEEDVLSPDLFDSPPQGGDS